MKLHLQKVTLAFIGGSSLAERGSQMDKTDANCFLS
jgi:hypothetical protein